LKTTLHDVGHLYKELHYYYIAIKTHFPAKFPGANGIIVPQKVDEPSILLTKQQSDKVS